MWPSFNDFVASYLSNNIATTDVRANIEDLTRNLFDDQATDILMFLAHLSHDPFIIARLVSTAREFFSGREPETLDELINIDIENVPLEYVERFANRSKSGTCEERGFEPRSRGYEGGNGTERSRVAGIYT